MPQNFTRRTFLGSAAAAAGSMAMFPWRTAGAVEAETAPAARGFRFVHLADIHVQPELRGGEGMAACLEAVETLDPKPDFILTGGDLVMDVFEQDTARSEALFKLYKKLLADHTGIPVRQCIGNHDVFGWSLQKGITPKTPGYGKAMVCEMLGLEKTYYRFDHRGWRFFVLDDIQQAPGNRYQAYLDEPQWDWLEKELSAKPAEMPAAVVCHIPILTVTVFGDARDGAYRVSNGLMCRDTRKLSDLFSKHNVKLVLTGHIHQQDRVEYRGVTHICQAAVSGAWWKGPHKGFAESFGVIDAAPDGTFRHQSHQYGWKA